jgi:hypothetical protein
MSDQITRYAWNGGHSLPFNIDPNGGWVTHEDHVEHESAAVAAARAESYKDGLMRGRYEHQVDAAIKGDSDEG